MIQKAIIVGRSDLEAHKYKVRIPILHGLPNTPESTPDEHLPHATVCGNPAVTSDFHSGDVVYVAFENGEFDFPVIIGQLIVNAQSANISSAGNQGVWDIRGTSLNIASTDTKCSAVLPSNTKIGEVNSDEISTLAGVRENIQNQLDTVDGNISNIEENINSIESDIGELNEEIDDIPQAVNKQLTDIGGSFGLSFTYIGLGECALTGLGECLHEGSIIIPTYSPAMQLVTEIRSNAVYGSEETIKGLVIPQGIKHIYLNALNGCPDLSTVFYRGLPSDWHLITKDGGWKGDSRVNTVICADGTQIDV